MPGSLIVLTISWNSRSGTDNPDQRISEDLNQFTSYVLTLSLGLLTSIVSLVSFLVILWGLSGPADIPLGTWGTLHIPAYLVWAALLYAGVGTWLTIKIGRPLVPLNFDQQRFEADFRFSLVRLRENAESVALYRGEAMELGVFHDRFRSVFENFWQIMKRQKRLCLVYIGLRPGCAYFSHRGRRAALLCKADRAGRPDAGGQRFHIGSEFALVHHYLVHQHRCLAGRNGAIERFRGTAVCDSSLAHASPETSSFVAEKVESRWRGSIWIFPMVRPCYVGLRLLPGGVRRC